MVDYSLYLIMFLLGTFKFMFASVPGTIAGVPFFAKFISVLLGGLVSFNLFYFMANFFIKKSLEKRLKKIEAGKLKRRKRFTKVNKTLVKLKTTSYGFFLISVLTPIVFSIPLGAIIVAKFYRHRKLSYWISTASLIVSCALFTYVIQLIKS